MILIGKPSIVDRGDKACVWAPVSVSDDTAAQYKNLKNELPQKGIAWRVDEDYPPDNWTLPEAGLWFSVDKQYRDCLCADRADAFLVAMLWYAMMTGSDIISEAPVSEAILFKINHFLQPALLHSEDHFIQIKCESIKTPYPSRNQVGTGMSCGVDSLYTLWKYHRKDVPEQYRLTHLTYFYHGSIFQTDYREKKHYSIQEFYEATDNKVLEKRAQAQTVADESHLPLVFVSTNLDKDYYRGAFGYTAVYRNCACALALQGLFGKYYLSSAGWPHFFELNIASGSEHYETLLSSVFSSESLTFFISDYVTRFEKTRALTDFLPAQKHLDVCYNFCNCGVCTKCRRTLLTLDALGAVEKFSAVFSLEDWKKNRSSAYAWMLQQKDDNEFKNNHAIYAKEIYKKAVENHTIPDEAIAIYEKQKTMHASKASLFSRVIGRLRATIR